MPTSPTDPDSASRLIVFAGEDGALARWLLLEGGAVVARGGAGLLPDDWDAALLAVPGTAVAIHWLELDEGLTRPQAAAAARLMLADMSAEPMSGMHVAVGRAEAGLTPVALVPVRAMADWLAAAGALGLDPDAIVPATMLLAPPEGAVARHGLDHRGAALAFALEPELAISLLDDAEMVEVDEAGFEAGLAPCAADPPLDLRQGPFAKRRPWRAGGAVLRRIGVALAALALLSIVVPLVTLMRVNRDAARMEDEAARLATSGPAAGPGFAVVVPALFDAVRATPNVELGRLDYRADGSLGATVLVDNPASLAALVARMADRGLDGAAGEVRTVAGRPGAEVRVRAR
jgi:general secretion pathway protein L